MNKKVICYNSLMKNEIDIIIIGAGASGLFLASHLKHKSYLILEHNPKIGMKIMVSGGGKCNLTNEDLSSQNYLANPRFVQHVIKRFDQDQLLSWLGDQGLIPELKKKNQYFCKHSADELIRVFKKNINMQNIKLNLSVLNVKKEGETFRVESDKGVFWSKAVVVATGGLSFPKLGASGIGYEIAQSFGHTIVPAKPALVGLTLQPEQFFFKSLAGVSTEVMISVGEKKLRGSLLFAHKGISGPVVLNASLYWEKGKITIDFLPDSNLKSLQNAKKKISNLLGVPSRLSRLFLEQLGIEDKPACRLIPQEWAKLEQLRSYTFAPAGTFGYTKAEVTKGGIDTSQVDAGSMMSKKVDNLYFLGEVLDVTGELGGYNFQWAFSSAFVCAKAIE